MIINDILDRLKIEIEINPEPFNIIFRDVTPKTKWAFKNQVLNGKQVSKNMKRVSLLTEAYHMKVDIAANGMVTRRPSPW